MRDQTSSNLKVKSNVVSVPHGTHQIRQKRTRSVRLRTISTGFCVITMTQWIDRFWYNIIGPTSKKNEAAPTTSPIRAAKFGATWLILERRYSCSSSRYAARDTTRSENLSMLIRSIGEISMPGRQTQRLCQERSKLKCTSRFKKVDCFSRQDPQ